MAAAQVAELMQSFANTYNSQNNCEQSRLLLDLEEQEMKYILTADIPGLEKADLKVLLPFLAQLFLSSSQSQEVCLSGMSCSA